jgi:hypothetical protein
MISTKELADESGLSPRVIQKRVSALNLNPKRVGLAMLLTTSEAAKVTAMSSKPGPKNGKRKK